MSKTECWGRFNWDDDEGIKVLLKQKIGIDSSSITKIERSDNTIKISAGDKNLLLKLNDERNKAILKSNDVLINKFDARIIKNGSDTILKLNLRGKIKNDLYPGLISICYLIAAFLSFGWASFYVNSFKNHIVFSGLLTFIALSIGCVLIGKLFTGSFKGILIDRRNKMSLSKLQILIWTLLVIPGFIVIAASKMVYGINNPLDVGIPESVWVLMGISTASFIGSPIIKKSKLDKQEKQATVSEEGSSNESKLDINDFVEDASIADLFHGEQETNMDNPDLGKIQMFVLTFVVWASYAILIIDLLSGIPTKYHEVINVQNKLSNDLLNTTLQLQLQDVTSRYFDMPDISGGMDALLGISNAGYLAFKGISRSDIKT
jgi:hypothetical protein